MGRYYAGTCFSSFFFVYVAKNTLIISYHITIIGGAKEQRLETYLVGWYNTEEDNYYLGMVDTFGSFIEVKYTYWLLSYYHIYMKIILIFFNLCSIQ